jgi:hypothetical protein
MRVPSASPSRFPSPTSYSQRCRRVGGSPNAVLDRSIQRRPLRLLFSPVNWVRLASPYFDRSDLAAEYHHRHLFGHRTVGALLRDGPGPFLTINATDMKLGFHFEFTQE